MRNRSAGTDHNADQGDLAGKDARALQEVLERRAPTGPDVGPDVATGPGAPAGQATPAGSNAPTRRGNATQLTEEYPLWRQMTAGSRQKLSRAAHLNLIDALSRFGASGLGVLAGLGLFGATIIGRAYPFRAGVWAVLIFAGLYICRRTRFDYRAGKAYAGRPFRWRAHYAAGLAVLSAAFGAGAFLLSPADASTAHSVQTMAALTGGLLIAAALHGAHANSAGATFLPGAVFIVAAAAARFGFSVPTLALTMTAVIGTIGLALIVQNIVARAERRFPRDHAPVRESLLAPRARPQATPQRQPAINTPGRRARAL